LGDLLTVKADLPRHSLDLVGKLPALDQLCRYGHGGLQSVITILRYVC
jgi:hypothetical protein